MKYMHLAITSKYLIKGFCHIMCLYSVAVLAPETGCVKIVRNTFLIVIGRKKYIHSSNCSKYNSLKQKKVFRH